MTSSNGIPSPARPSASIFGNGGGSLFNRKKPASPASATDTPTRAGRAASPAQAEVKPEVKVQTISITVKDGHNDLAFKMRRDRPLEKLMLAACQHFGKGIKDCRFMIDGLRIQKDQTPAELDMEDEDIIELFTEQVGGN